MIGMPEHAFPMFERPAGFVYQYVFDIFCSSHLYMNAGLWKD